MVAVPNEQHSLPLAQPSGRSRRAPRRFRATALLPLTRPHPPRRAPRAPAAVGGTVKAWRCVCAAVPLLMVTLVLFLSPSPPPSAYGPYSPRRWSARQSPPARSECARGGGAGAHPTGAQSPVVPMWVGVSEVDSNGGGGAGVLVDLCRSSVLAISTRTSTQIASSLAR